MLAVTELRPHQPHKGNTALARRLRVAMPVGCQKAKLLADALALFAGEALIVEVFGVVAEAFHFGHSHGHNSPREICVLAKTSISYLRIRRYSGSHAAVP